ncbi:MAG: ADOP family duplicated permease [Terriglobales bacterium]
MGFWRKLARTVRPARMTRDIAEEIDHHLTLRQREQPHTRFGNAERVRERTRDMDVLTWIESWLQDLRHAARMLRHSPGFTVVVVASLAIGLGANAAIFSLVNAVLLKTLPVPNPQQIVLLGQKGTGMSSSMLSYPLIQQFAQARVRVGAASATETMTLGPPRTHAERAGVQLVTGGYFAGLALQPVLGRWVNRSDNRALGASPVADVSYAFWQKRFGGSRNIIGQTVPIGKTVLTIIGVAPRGFAGLDPASPATIWAPVMMQPVLHISDDRVSVDGSDSKPWPPQEQIFWLQGFARVPNARAMQRLQTEWNGLLQQSWKRIAPEYKPWTLTLAPGGHGVSGLQRAYGAPLRVLMGLAALLLLIAIANVTAMLLARTLGRQREIAIRLAVGISRARLARQLLTEALLLTAVAGAAAAALAVALSHLLTQLAGNRFQPDLDWRVWGLLALLALGTGVILGLLPARLVRRQSPASALQAGMRTGASSARLPLGRGLIIVQVALALLLVAGAGLFSRSLAAMFTRPLGFDRAHLLSAELARPSPEPPLPQLEALERRALARVEALPGVRAAALEQNGIDDGSTDTSSTFPAGYAGPGFASNGAGISVNYFEATGIPLLRGRAFRSSDTAQARKVVIVNEAFVQQVLHGATALGTTMGSDPRDEGKFEIVGVAANARLVDPHRAAAPLVYFPLAQYDKSAMHLDIRSAGDPAVLAPEVRKALTGAGLRLRSVATIDEVLAGRLRRDRLLAELSGAFGLLALALACLGLFGVVAYGAGARRGEFGIRVALGAEHGHVLRLVLGEAAVLTATGLAIGLLLGWWAAPWLQPLLPGVSAHDAAAFGGAAAALLLVPLLAALPPAWRAARTDPMRTLRME